MKDAGDIAFDSVIREVGLSNLCSPFGLQVKIGLLPVEDFSQRITCTLDKVVSNIQNFYVDFSVGGWRGYNLLWQPENNYYGVTINIADQITKLVTEKKDVAKSEGLAGSGFMGDKTCKAGAGRDNELAAETATSGWGEQCSDDLNTMIEACEDPTYAMQFAPSDGSWDVGMMRCKEQARQELSDCNNEGIDAWAKTKGYKTDRSGEYCDPKDMVDTNPGSLVGKAVGEAITSDSKWAANIQSWVSALVNAIINRVIQEGVGAMKEMTGSQRDSYRPPEYQNMMTQEFEKDKQQMRGEISRFTNEWQYLINAKNQSLSSASSTLANLQQLRQIQLTQTSLPSACEPLVTEQEIQIVQSEITRLTNEINELQAKMNAANDVIIQLNKADFFNERQRAAAQTKYQEFINKYGTTAQIEAIVSGSARQSADTEKQNKQTERDNIQLRLTTCQAAINPAP